MKSYAKFDARRPRRHRLQAGSDPAATATAPYAERDPAMRVSQTVRSRRVRSRRVPRNHAEAVPFVTQFLRARSARRLRARRVRRLVRHVEPWSVLKISIFLYSCMWGVLLLVGVILWKLASESGLITNMEKFITKLGALESFTFHGDLIFRVAFAVGLIIVLALTVFTVLCAVLFNLISDITGGVRFTVVEEETARPMVRKTGKRGRVIMPAPSSGSNPNADAGVVPGVASTDTGVASAGVGVGSADVVSSSVSTY